MTKYNYTAKAKDGTTKTGAVEATDKKGAVRAITQDNLQPILIKEAKTGFDPNNLQFKFLRRNRVKTRDMVIFTRQLATMINAGVPLVRSLATLQKQSDSPFLQEQLEAVSKEVESGTSFADALENHPKVFNQVYVSMVRAGEAGGILDDILKRLATQVEKQSAMKKKIKSASTYPVILLTITTAAFLGLMIFMVPKIGKIIKDLAGEDAELPKLTQFMLGLSDFIVHQWYIVIAGMFLAVYLFRRYIKSKKGRKKFHYVLLKTPIVNKIVAKVAIARFARTFASLMGAGVSVLDALNVTKDTVGNAIVEEELEYAAKEVKNGKPLSEPLSKSKVFPPIVSEMLAVGEETGQVEEILKKVADFYEEEVDAVVDGLSAIIEPVMIVILGAIVGVIAYSVMGPITSLSKQIKS